MCVEVRERRRQWAGNEHVEAAEPVGAAQGFMAVNGLCKALESGPHRTRSGEKLRAADAHSLGQGDCPNIW